MKEYFEFTLKTVSEKPIKHLKNVEDEAKKKRSRSKLVQKIRSKQETYYVKYQGIEIASNTIHRPKPRI